MFSFKLQVHKCSHLGYVVIVYEIVLQGLDLELKHITMSIYFK